MHGLEDVQLLTDDMQSEIKTAPQRTSACRRVAVSGLVIALVGTVSMLNIGFPMESLKTTTAKDVIVSKAEVDGYLKHPRQRCAQGGSFCPPKGEDVLTAAQAECESKPDCRGFMLAPKWKGGKCVQLCKSEAMSANPDWTVYVHASREGNVFNKYTTWTSPYYFHRGVCPEGQTIILKEDCKQAGGLLGLGGDINEVRHSVGCTKAHKGVNWHPDLKAKGVMNGFIISICKKLPKDMHDFASLQADLEKMTFHCLNEATNYNGFRRCMSEVKKWNLEAAWTEADLQAQLEVIQQAEDKKAQEKAKAEKACWGKKTDDQFGASAWQEFHKRGSSFPRANSMMDIKIKCVQQGKTKCTGISCYSAWNMFTESYYDRCQVNGPNDKMVKAIDTSNQRFKKKYATYTLC